MSKKYTQDTIERYLKKQLRGEELEAFETQLNTDRDLKKEVETQGLLYRAANKAGEDEMRAKLKKIRMDVLEKTESRPEAKVVAIESGRKRNPVLRWSIAAAVIIALGASLYWLLPRSNSPDELFAAYYHPYSEEITVRGNINETMLAQGSAFYGNADYQNALPLFLQALESDESNAEVRLAAGVCQLELGRHAAAIETFHAINNPLYRDQAQWYLAMTYLKQKDWEKAKSILQQIQSGAFHTKAREILEKLD